MANSLRTVLLALLCVLVNATAQPAPSGSHLGSYYVGSWQSGADSQGLEWSTSVSLVNVTSIQKRALIVPFDSNGQGLGCQDVVIASNGQVRRSIGATIGTGTTGSGVVKVAVVKALPMGGFAPDLGLVGFQEKILKAPGVGNLQFQGVTNGTIVSTSTFAGAANGTVDGSISGDSTFNGGVTGTAIYRGEERGTSAENGSIVGNSTIEAASTAEGTYSGNSSCESSFQGSYAGNHNKDIFETLVEIVDKVTSYIDKILDAFTLGTVGKIRGGEILGAILGPEIESPMVGKIVEVGTSGGVSKEALLGMLRSEQQRATAGASETENGNLVSLCDDLGRDFSTEEACRLLRQVKPFFNTALEPMLNQIRRLVPALEIALAEGLFKDSDEDGIINKFDFCPKRPEDRNDVQDLDGCPERGVPIEWIAASTRESGTLEGEDEAQCTQQGNISLAGKINGSDTLEATYNGTNTYSGAHDGEVLYGTGPLPGQTGTAGTPWVKVSGTDTLDAALDGILNATLSGSDQANGNFAGTVTGSGNLSFVSVAISEAPLWIIPEFALMADENNDGKPDELNLILTACGLGQ